MTQKVLQIPLLQQELSNQERIQEKHVDWADAVEMNPGLKYLIAVGEKVANKEIVKTEKLDLVTEL